MHVVAPELKTFGRIMKARRLDLKMSHADLARAIGVSASQVSNMERGDNYPSLPVYVALCFALGYVKIPLLEKRTPPNVAGT